MGTGATDMSTTQQFEALRAAAQAVIDSWETPLWKDVPATAEYIAALRDALEADHIGEATDIVGRWYMVTWDGAATLCVDREDAEKEAKDADMAWPLSGPHRAVRLVDAADMEALRAGYAAARLEIESLQARIKTMAEEHADELMVAHLDGRMRAGQPTDAMLGEQAELRRLSDCCPELNLSNYGPDDVDELNGWAIEVSQCIDRTLAAQPAGAQQPTTQTAPQQEVQEPGWVLVPAEATDAMMAAFAKAADADVDWHNATESDRQDVRDGFCPAYRAMLRAAPQPLPASQEGK